MPDSNESRVIEAEGHEKSPLRQDRRPVLPDRLSVDGKA